MRKFLLAVGLGMPAAPAMAAGFTVTATDFHDGGTIPMAQVFNASGCTGGNHSPAIFRVRRAGRHEKFRGDDV